MAVETSTRTFGTGVVPVKMVLTSGTWYTLWAPHWMVKGESWQAFLGNDDKIYVFSSPAEILAYLNDGGQNELSDHPKWSQFSANLDANVIPTEKTTIDLIELPRVLAQRPGYESTTTVTRAFDLVRSFGSVMDIKDINNWFHSYSILGNTRRGADHYASQNGMEEWSGVGRTVLDRWKTILDAIEAAIIHPEVKESSTEAAQERIDSAKKAAEDKAEALAKEQQKDKEAADIDPYDSTIWAQSGIDPIRISLGGQYAYTLRCYVGDKPLFLGRNGEIHTFPNAKTLVRWIIDAPEHDLESLSTWGDIVSMANAGELDVKVHDTNQYVFTGLREDIAKSVESVDTDQLGRAYELLADAADWAGDDGVNKVLLAYPELQNYLAYMLGAPSSATPSAPFDKEAKGWKALEEGLTKRFTRF